MNNPKFIKNNIQSIPLDLGKMPPQAIELEESVLGALMLESECYYKIGHILTPECFYKDAHQKIYTAIVELASKNKKADILTVTEQLRKNKTIEEVGGPYYVANLTSRVGGAGNIEYHSYLIKQKFIQREIIRMSSDLQSKAYDDIDVNDLLELAQKELFKIVLGTITQEAVKASILISIEIKGLEEKIKNNVQCTGVPSGFTNLDRISGGWQSPDLIILAARPSQGKTAVAIYFGMFPATLNIPVVIFSLEMSKEQVAQRLISYTSKVDSIKFKNLKLHSEDFKQMDKSLGQFDNMPLYVDDTPALSIVEFSSKANLYKMKYGVKLIIIDYLQLMQGQKGVNRDQEIGTITRCIKSVSKTLNVPIIALSQLNREVEKKGNKRPQLSDLRESGNIEQDADIVAFIHRPEKYGETEMDIPGLGKNISTVGLLDIIISKNRNGAVGDAILWTDDSFNNLREEKEMFPELKDLPMPVNNEFNINKTTESNRDDVPF